MGVRHFGFIDRLVAWCVHCLSGVTLDRSQVCEEQDEAATDNIRDVSQRSATGRVQGGGPAAVDTDGVSGESRSERFIRGESVEVYPQAQTTRHNFN